MVLLLYCSGMLRYVGYLSECVCACGGRHWQFGVWLCFLTFSVYFSMGIGCFLFLLTPWQAKSFSVLCISFFALKLHGQSMCLCLPAGEHNLLSPSNAFPKRGGGQKGRSSPFSLSLFAREICFAYGTIQQFRLRLESSQLIQEQHRGSFWMRRLADLLCGGAPGRGREVPG